MNEFTKHEQLKKEGYKNLPFLCLIIDHQR